MAANGINSVINFAILENSFRSLCPILVKELSEPPANDYPIQTLIEPQPLLVFHIKSPAAAKQFAELYPKIKSSVRGRTFYNGEAEVDLEQMRNGERTYLGLMEEQVKKQARMDILETAHQCLSDLIRHWDASENKEHAIASLQHSGLIYQEILARFSPTEIDEMKLHYDSHVFTDHKCAVQMRANYESALGRAKQDFLAADTELEKYISNHDETATKVQDLINKDKLPRLYKTRQDTGGIYIIPPPRSSDTFRKLEDVEVAGELETAFSTSSAHGEDLYIGLYIDNPLFDACRARMGEKLRRNIFANDDGEIPEIPAFAIQRCAQRAMSGIQLAGK